MRRLLQYLRPYWRQVLLAFVTIIVSAVASLVQPYLIKVAIDRYITQRQMAGLDGLAVLYLIAIAIYVASRIVRRREGIDLGMVNSEIPVE